MAEKKLHIPAPDEQDTDVEGDISILFLSFIICAGIGFSTLYYFSVVQERPDVAATAASSVKTEKEVDPRQEVLKKQRAISDQFDDYSDDDLAAHEFTEEEEIAVLRLGPRGASEHLCETYSDRIRKGRLDPLRLIELTHLLERRAEYAPWTCMTRLHLAADLPQQKLTHAMAGFWKDVEKFEGNPRIMASVLADFRRKRDRPAAPEFYRWLRRCALNYDYQATTECRRLLYQVSPAQGSDILAMIERHLRDIDTEISKEEGELVIDALGRLTRNGQPPNWKVEQTDALADYDTDLRMASVLYLCRFVHSPQTELALEAAEELRRTAEAAGRAYDKRLLGRWLETCRIAYDGGKFVKHVRDVQIVASWDGEEDSPPDYSLEQVQELGHCETKPGHPIWWCGASQFAGRLQELDRALATYFIETRFMEWPASHESLLADP